MLDIIAKVFALLALPLAAISFAWQVLTHHHKHKEIIKAKLSITIVPVEHGKNLPALNLEVSNHGQVSVYIKSVALSWGDEDSTLGDVLHQLRFQGYPPVKGPLHPGDGKNYVLPAIIPQMLSKANNQPQDKVWISIKSQKTEVLRLHGNHLKGCLDMIVQLSDSRRKNEKS
jgi:hypothetical protein